MKRAPAAALMLGLMLPASSNAAATRVATATGIPAVLNGIAAIDLRAAAPMPLGIPAPAGHVTLALQSTFEPPKPLVVSIQLWCTAVSDGPDGPTFYGSGTGPDGQAWHVSLGQRGLLWVVGWSRTASGNPCGGPGPGHPLIGAAAITP